MPQNWDTGQILSLPLRRKPCGGFFRLRPGLNSRTPVPDASMLTTSPPKPSAGYNTCHSILFCIKAGDEFMIKFSLFFPNFLHFGYQVQYSKSKDLILNPTNVFKISSIFDFLFPYRSGGLVIACNNFPVALLIFM